MIAASLNEFVRNSDTHPRAGKLDNDAIERYVARYDAGEQAEPILVQRNTMTVIDGWHRIEAAARVGLTELEFKEVNIPHEDIKRTAFQLNRDHGVPITKEQRNALIVEDAARFTQEELAEFYGLTQPAIVYILNISNIKTDNINKADHRKKVEAADIVAAWRLNPESTQKEIAAQFNIEQSRVAQILIDFRSKVIGAYESGKLKTVVANEFSLSLETIDSILMGADHEPINFEPNIYQVWNVGKRDQRYGQKHPGQLPAKILQNLLYYYTRPGDYIVDLFAGGGVTLDVAADMVNRTCDAYDIESARSDIKEWDLLRIESGYYKVQLPDTVSRAKLIFLDPPYWKQKQGDYTKKETDLSNLPLDIFHKTLADIVRVCLLAIPTDAYVALIIGPTQEKWHLIDHAAHIMKRIGVPTYRIQVPYSTQQHSGNFVNLAKESRRWLYLSRDLMIWQKNDIPSIGAPE